MTLKSLSSENKNRQELQGVSLQSSGVSGGSGNGSRPEQERKASAGISFRQLVSQSIRGNLWLVLLALLTMLFNYPVNLAVQLTSLQQEFEQQGYTVTTTMMGAESGQAASVGAAATITMTSDMSSVIGGADGPTSIFIAGKTTQYGESLSDLTNRVLIGSSSMITVIVVVAAALCAFAMFHYLYSRPQVDFYHSLPVSRTKRFCAHYLGGALIMAGSHLVGLLGVGVVALVFRVPELMLGPAVWVNASFFLLFLLIYTATIGALLMAGNLAVGALATVWLWSIGPAAAGVIYTLKSVHFDTLYDPAGAEQRLQYFSPVKYLFEYASYAFRLAEAGNTPAAQDAKRVAALAPHAAKVLMFAAALTALGFVVVMFLYRRRASERAGNAVAFHGVKAPVRILTTVLAALTLSLFGTALNSTAWTVFFTVVTAIIVHAVMEVIIQLDIKKLLAHKGELLFSIVLSVLIVGAFQFDVFGYNKYIPAASEIESAAVYTSYLGNQDEQDAVVCAEQEYGSVADGTFDENALLETRYYGYLSSNSVISRMQLTGTAEIETVRKLAELGLEDRQITGGNPYVTYLSDEGAQRQYIRIRYQLKNGRTEDRNYYLPEKELTEELQSLFMEPDYKEAAYPILKLAPKEAGTFGLKLSRTALEQTDEKALSELSELPATLSNQYYYSDGEDHVLDLRGLSADIGEQLLSALQKDLENMKLSDCDPNWTAELNGDTEAKTYSYLIYVPLEEQLAAEHRAQTAAGAAFASESASGSASESAPTSASAEQSGETTRTGREYVDYWYFDVYPIYESFVNVREVLAAYGVEV